MKVIRILEMLQLEDITLVAITPYAYYMYMGCTARGGNGETFFHRNLGTSPLCSKIRYVSH